MEPQLIENDMKMAVDPDPRSDTHHKIPLTTYLTPYALVSRRLLAFNRETHLMPLVYTYYKQVRAISHHRYDWYNDLA